MRKLIAATFLLFAVAIAPTARADDAGVSWQSAAGGCVPVSGVVGNFDSLLGGGVAFKSGVTGLLQWVCPVQTLNAANAPNHLTLTWVDNSTGASDYTKATLVEANRTSGTTSNISIVTSSGSSGTITQSSSAFTYTFDFANAYYYVVISVSRSSTAVEEAFQVSIED